MYAKFIDEDGRWLFSVTPIAGAVRITKDEHVELLNGQGLKTISIGEDGGPSLIENAPPTKDQIESSRLMAYADPVTGSDRYFAEAQREMAAGNVERATEAKEMGLLRYSEIQIKYPWPKS